MFNINTGEWIRRVSSITAASILIFGSADRRHIIRQYLGALSGVKWSEGRVIITHPGQPLTDKPVQYWIAHNHSPLEVPNFPLASLNLPFVYIFTLDLLPFPGQYTFLTYSAAIQYLSPEACSGLTSKQAEVKSRGLQRNCNFHNTTKTESGPVYIARHPSLVNRKRST